MALVADVLGSATKVTSGPIEQTLLGVDTIKQDEDLYTVRPRYYDQLSRGDRGVRATFTIISFLKDQKQITPANQTTQKLRQRLLADSSKPYADFLITGLNFSFQEKIQLQPVFGDHTVAYAFGAAPVVLNISGILTDDIDNDWFYNYLVLYRDYLRGTQLARNFELAQLSMHNADYLGIVMGVSFAQDATNDALIQFQMQFLVREYLPYSAQQVRKEDVDDDSIEKLQASIGKNDKGLFNVTPLGDIRKQVNDALKFDVPSSLKDKVLGLATQGIAGCNSSTTVGPPSADNIAVLKVNVGGIVGLGQMLSSFGSFNSSQAGKATWLENKLGKVGCSDAGSKVLSVVGAYGNGVQKLNKGVTSFGDTLTTVQRNLEVFNRAVGYLSNPVPELLDTLANIRQQVNKVTELANMVKKSYQDLKNIKNSFNSFSSEWDQLKKDFGNMKGAFSSFNESSADRLRGSFKNNSASIPPVLGNAKLGITPEQAMAKLNAIGNQSTAEKFVLPNASSDYSSNADQKAVLSF